MSPPKAADLGSQIENPFANNQHAGSQTTDPGLSGNIPPPTFKRVQSRKSMTNLPAQAPQPQAPPPTPPEPPAPPFPQPQAPPPTPPEPPASPFPQPQASPPTPPALTPREPSPPKMPGPSTPPPPPMAQKHAGPPPMPQRHAGPPPLPQRGATPPPAPPVPEPIQTPPDSQREPDIGDGPNLQFEWSSTSTSQDVNKAGDSPLKGETKDENPMDNYFPKHSIDFRKPDPNVQKISLTKPSEPEEKTESPWATASKQTIDEPGTPPEKKEPPAQESSQKAKPDAASPLPKMKKFGQISKKNPPTPPVMQKSTNDTKGQFPQLADSSQQPAKPIEELDSRHTARPPESIDQPPEAPTPSDQPIPKREHNSPGSEKKLYNIEGKEISEPRELSKPDLTSFNQKPPGPDSELPVSKEQDQHLEIRENSQPGTDISDGDKEAALTQANAHIRTAESALTNDNYSVAVPLLNKALMLLTESDALNSSESLSCYQKLGECSYQKSDYEEAIEHYEKCRSIIQNLGDVDKDTIVLIQQKLAKTLEKANRFSEARTASQESLDMATELLENGHPLIAVAFRMHLALLQKTNAPISEIEFVESSMRESERLESQPVNVSDEINAHVQYLTGSFKLDNIEKQKQFKMSKSRLTEASQHRKNPVPIIIAVVVIALVGGTAGGIYMFMSNNKGAETTTDIPATKAIASGNFKVSKEMSPYVDKSYIAADGLKSMKIQADGIVEFKIGETTRSFNWEEGAPAENVISNLTSAIGNKATYTLTETNQGFVDQDGTILYSENATDMKIVKEMKHISELAKYYYQSFDHKYPAKRSNFSKLGPAIELVNPLGSGMKPLVRLRQFNKDEGQVVLEQTLDEFKTGGPFFQPDKTNKPYPGLIECMSLRSFEKAEEPDGISFMIRAYGESGEFISSSIKGNNYVVAQEKAVDLSLIKPENMKVPFDSKKETTVHFVLKK